MHQITRTTNSKNDIKCKLQFNLKHEPSVHMNPSIMAVQTVATQIGLGSDSINTKNSPLRIARAFENRTADDVLREASLPTYDVTKDYIDMSKEHICLFNC